MSTRRTTTEVLAGVEMTMFTAEEGLRALLSGVGPQKIAGLNSLVTFGRAVTNGLQNLRNIEPTFEEWYEPYRQEMSADPLMKYFYILRSQILKESLSGARGGNAYIEQWPPPGGMPTPPPNAQGFFTGDQMGGSGWEVALANGTTEKYYISLPEDLGRAWLSFDKPPTIHLGQSIEDTSVEGLSKLFVAYLRRMLDDAKEQFSSSSS